MKLSTLSLCVLTCHNLVKGAAATAPTIAHFTPLKVPFETLLTVNDDYSNALRKPLMKALQEVGMVSITQVPKMKEMKAAALSWDLHLCTHASSAAQSHQYLDGSHRRTLATHTIPGGSTKFEHKADTSACDKFDDAAAHFRATVDEVTSLFATKLSSLLLHKGLEASSPLLKTTNTNFSLATVADIVLHGEHLEHFHSYQRLEVENERSQENDVRTMDLHLDQGLFLIFAPGRMIKQDASQSTSMSEGFTIQLQDGTQAVVDFDEDDDLVVLLGDGVNQYINPRMPDNQALRALPHALALPAHSEEEARVWYGRMVLPPSSAIHPVHGKTFGELRDELIKASTASDDKSINVLSLGCASNSQVARQLEEVSCTADALMCWHKCMSLAEFNVSAEMCESQDKQIFCINPRGQLWDGNHGDFYPGCATNDTEVATPFLTLPSYPPDTDVCTNASFVEFANLVPYEYQIDLGASGALFLWNLTDGYVHGRIVFNGLLGYLSIGLANVGGAKNGMHGANILMAIPGGNYSAISGFDLSIAPSIQEFQISPNPEQSSFRFWGVDDGATAQARQAGAISELDITDCFSSFMFEADSINGIPFNLTGVDQLLWAANNIDSFAGYHGMNRGRFSIDWPTGEAKLYELPAPIATASAAGNVGIFAPLCFVVLAVIGMMQ